MALVIQTNSAAMAAQKNLNANQKQLAGSFQKLSSGFRVNTAADDAAGLAVSESMKSQIRSYTVAERNAGDAISMAQTAEGSLGEVHDILGRMRELATQSSNGSLTDTDRGYLNTEFGALQSEITRIQGSAKFNGVSLVNATAATVKFQVGLNNTGSDQIDVTFGGVSLTGVGSGSASVSQASSALKALRLVRSLEHVWVNEEVEARHFARARALATQQFMGVHDVASVEETIAGAGLVLSTRCVSLGVF